MMTLFNPRQSKVTVGLISVILITPSKLPAAENNIFPSALATPALQNEQFGLFPAENFRLTTGTCTDCPTPKQALWYFRNELVAVPKGYVKVAGLATKSGSYENILRAIQDLDFQSRQRYPSLIWIGSPEIIKRATLSEDGRIIETPGREKLAFSLVPKIPSNRSYYDASSIYFFRQRTLRLRGTTKFENGARTFIARTMWPEDFRIDAGAMRPEPLQAKERLSDLIVAAKGGASSPFQPRLLWRSKSENQQNWAGRPILGLLLSGGQGDDDGSQAGHLAVVTGKVGANGEMADWTANNFYNLDEESEKGIIASMLPMDNYLMDLNSGQSYYRPVYLLIAVLKEERAAERFQWAIQPLYNHFYRHDFPYHHSTVNCTGISIDTLRALGWQIPRKGSSGYARALVASLYVSITERSIGSGKKIFHYLTEEQTRLFPRAAFEIAAQDLLMIVDEQNYALGRKWTDYERVLRDDVIAVLFVRIPQIPSSRALGTYPVASFDEYRNRVPTDRSQWKTVSVNVRPFPDSLKEPLDVEHRTIDIFFRTSLALMLGVLVASTLVLRRWRRSVTNFLLELFARLTQK